VTSSALARRRPLPPNLPNHLFTPLFTPLFTTLFTPLFATLFTPPVQAQVIIDLATGLISDSVPSPTDPFTPLFTPPFKTDPFTPLFTPLQVIIDLATGLITASVPSPTDLAPTADARSTIVDAAVAPERSLIATSCLGGGKVRLADLQ
jgi:hypothetical protein